MSAEDVFEVDERFLPIATLQAVSDYMQAKDQHKFVSNLLVKKKVAKKSDYDFEQTVREADDMLSALSLRVVHDFLTQTRH